MAVAFDAVSAAATGSNVTSMSFTHTPVGTPTGVGVAIGWWNGNNTISSGTYGGTAMAAQVTSALGPGNDRAAIWGLANPASGAQTVQLNFSSNIYPIAAAITVTGGDTTTLASNTSSATGTSTAPSTTCTSATDELVMDVVLRAASTGDLTPGSGQTGRFASNNGGERAEGSTEAGAASVTMDWSAGASASWAIAAMSFKAAAAGGGGVLFGSGPLVYGPLYSGRLHA